MRKKILEQKLLRLQNKKAKINERCNAATEVSEVRSLTEELEDVNAEIAETQAELDVIAEEERSQAEERSHAPAQAQIVNAGVVASYGLGNPVEERTEELTASMEYRRAFMGYVQTGAPMNIRGEMIDIPDVGPAIPLTIMNEVINTVRKRYGNLYNKVRKLAVKGGVEFPIGSLQASFKWINESTVSPRQKVGQVGKVSFNYYTAEIRIAQSFLSSIVALDAFEAKIVELIAVAYLKAMDTAIVKGTGDGQPLGILNDTRVTGLSQVVTFTAAQINNWQYWRKNFFAQLPLGYRDGEFIFPLATVDAYLETMADANGNPIFRQATGLEVNDGDAMNPNGRFFGRDISLVEPDIIKDFDTASSNDVIGIFWQPEEYAINENFGFTMRRYFDEETNEWVDKALVVVDGKVLNPNGIWILKKA